MAQASAATAGASTRISRAARAEQPVVVTQGLTKIFRDFWMRSRVRAVDNLDMEIHQHEIFGLLGPNGSGKSTTIKILLGLLHKTSGRVAVFGKPPSDVAVKRRIGVLPEESYLYPFLNARETLDYYGKLFELDHRVRRKRIDELLDMVGLTAVQFRQVKEYSKGMQRRIGIAQALINDPEFLILDEPTTGLDPIGSRQIKDLILDLGRRGKTILLSSHQLSDVEDCVDRLVILYGGKKRAQGTCDELLVARERMTIETDILDEQTIEEIDRVLRERTGSAITRVSKPRQKLEELFIDIVERARAERIETSGAVAGGQTASFLLGEVSDQTEGDALIDRLVAEAPPAPQKQQPEQPAQPQTPTGPDAVLIDDLLSTPEEVEDAEEATVSVDRGDDAPRRRQPEASPAKRPDDFDEDLIRSLIDTEKSADNEKPESRGGER
ncbi:MAG: ABC transporter ATP-binding protein [Phycisphaeraceae bacterium]|nr:MAG: ABC transporter ATP-binding protein [Phycisphaeraceae bacterium]